MRTIVASSASPELVHYHGDTVPSYLSEARESIYSATREALYELSSLIVGAEHTIETLSAELGIHDFSHHIANRNLTGAKVTLYSNGHIEIRRDGTEHATTFPVQLIA